MALLSCFHLYDLLVYSRPSKSMEHCTSLCMFPPLEGLMDLVDLQCIMYTMYNLHTLQCIMYTMYILYTLKFIMYTMYNLYTLQCIV